MNWREIYLAFFDAELFPQNRGRHFSSSGGTFPEKPPELIELVEKARANIKDEEGLFPMVSGCKRLQSIGHAEQQCALCSFRY
jgi:hypothetical protein